jgi:hypothetical protein
VLYAWRRLYVIRGAMFVFVRLVSRGSERGAKRRIVRAIASFWSIADAGLWEHMCAPRRLIS